jgi:uncharacterized Ntn-hydrolase superfamily protein
MAKAFRETQGELAERMIAALEAAQAAGGDKRGQQSAALLIVRPSTGNPEYNERYIDLRVEDHKTPIKELRRVWQIFQGFHLANAHLTYATAFEARRKTSLPKSGRRDARRPGTRREGSSSSTIAWPAHERHLPAAGRQGGAAP